MHTWNLPCDRLGILSISSVLPQILPQTSSQTQGKQRVSRMEHQTPSVFPGNFRKRKVLGTLCFPFCLPENWVEPNSAACTSILDTVFVMTPPNEHTSEGGRDDRGVPYHAESTLSSAQVLKYDRSSGYRESDPTRRHRPMMVPQSQPPEATYRCVEPAVAVTCGSTTPRRLCL